MERKELYTYLTLLLLTVFTAYFANNYHGIKIFSILILILSGIKFLLVAFNFMELKKAHPFWKVLLVSYLTIFITIVSILL